MKLKVIFLFQNQPKDAALYWRPMGQGEFVRTPLEHISRAVYTVRAGPETVRSDVEYYIQVTNRAGQDAERSRHCAAD